MNVIGDEREVLLVRNEFRNVDAVNVIGDCGGPNGEVVNASTALGGAASGADRCAVSRETVSSGWCEGPGMMFVERVVVWGEAGVRKGWQGVGL